MQIQAIKVQRLYLQVAQQLRELIASGAFEQGQRLPSERDLAAQFQVSRPTIREAMIALEISGMVDVRSGSGVYVTGHGEGVQALSDESAPGPFEILEARKLVEGDTAALAAERISKAQLQRLQELLHEMERENKQDAVTEKADEEFHCLIAEAAGNSALSTTVAWLWQLRNESAISTHFFTRVREEGGRPIIEDHQRIFDALSARDPLASKEAMCSHLQRVIDQLVTVFDYDDQNRSVNKTTAS